MNTKTILLLLVTYLLAMHTKGQVVHKNRYVAEQAVQQGNTFINLTTFKTFDEYRGAENYKHYTYKGVNLATGYYIKNKLGILTDISVAQSNRMPATEGAASTPAKTVVDAGLQVRYHFYNYYGVTFYLQSGLGAGNIMSASPAYFKANILRFGFNHHVPYLPKLKERLAIGGQIGYVSDRSVAGTKEFNHTFNVHLGINYYLLGSPKTNVQ